MRIFIFFLFLSTSNGLHSQEYLSGKLVDRAGVENEVFYDRTVTDISGGVFQTVYKVTDLDKKLLYTVTLTNNSKSGILFVSDKPYYMDPGAKTITYNRYKCGLILSDASSQDAQFNLSDDYTYLFSFTDTSFTYPILHLLKTPDAKILKLDNLSSIRIAMHRNEIKRIASQNPFNYRLFRLNDSLYTHLHVHQDTMDSLKKELYARSNSIMKGKPITSKTNRYSGEKVKGRPYGIGLKIVDGNIYSGKFIEGNFTEGDVLIRNNDYEYCGHFKNDSMNGNGRLTYKNGSFLLGWFRNNKLLNGEALQKPNEDEMYLGNFNTKRHGYGEITYTNGGRVVGEFYNNNLVSGYIKEIDPFGFYTYSTIENGNKVTIDAKRGEDFFSLLTSEPQK